MEDQGLLQTEPNVSKSSEDLKILKMFAKQLRTGVIGMARGVAHQIQHLTSGKKDRLFRIQSMLEEPPWSPVLTVYIYIHTYNIELWQITHL